MFCPNCGKEIPDDSKFCLYCGKQLKAKSHLGSSLAPPPTRKSPLFKPIDVILIAILVVAVTIYVISTISVNITTDPPSASLSIDGNLVGSTPISNFKLWIGTHKFELVREGYGVYEKDIYIAPWTDHNMNFVLEKLGILLVFSNPSGAEVRITRNLLFGGPSFSDTAFTPAKIEAPDGEYDLEISEYGYETYSSRWVSVHSGRTTTVDVVLERHF